MTPIAAAPDSRRTLAGMAAAPAATPAPATRRPELATRLALLVAVIGGSVLVLRFGLTTFSPTPEPGVATPDLLERWVQFFSYWTIQSNIAVLLASLAVVLGRDVTSPGQRALRLGAMIGITVTGVIYVTILASLPAVRTTGDWIANIGLHYVIPPLALGSWLLAGPRSDLRLADIPRMLLWPLGWFLWTLLHGAITEWYPYGFIDVELHGYPRVLATFLVIAAGAALLGAALVAWDRWRLRASTATT